VPKDTLVTVSIPAGPLDDAPQATLSWCPHNQPHIAQGRRILGCNPGYTAAEVTVTAEKLIAVCKHTNSDELILSVGTYDHWQGCRAKELVIEAECPLQHSRYGSSSATFGLADKSADLKVRLTPPSIGRQYYWQVDATKLAEAVRDVVIACGDHEAYGGRYALGCIQVTFTEDQLSLKAADGRRLHEKSIPACRDDFSGSMTGLLPDHAVKPLRDFLKIHSVRDIFVTLVQMGDEEKSWVIFEADGDVLAVVQGEGNFPQTDDLVPSSRPARLYFDPKRWTKALDSLKAVLRKADHELHIVMDIAPGSNYATLRAKSQGKPISFEVPVEVNKPDGWGAYRGEIDRLITAFDARYMIEAINAGTSLVSGTGKAKCYSEVCIEFRSWCDPLVITGANGFKAIVMPRTLDPCDQPKEPKVPEDGSDLPEPVEAEPCLECGTRGGYSTTHTKPDRPRGLCRRCYNAGRRKQRREAEVAVVSVPFKKGA
jgi:hypothetical protein